MRLGSEKMRTSEVRKIFSVIEDNIDKRFHALSEFENKNSFGFGYALGAHDELLYLKEELEEIFPDNKKGKAAL